LRIVQDDRNGSRYPSPDYVKVCLQPALPNRPGGLEAPALSQRLHDCLATIADPRVERTRLHQLSDILTIAILSVIAGGNGWEDMEVYGLSKEAWLSTFLALPNGIQVRIPFGEY